MPSIRVTSFGGNDDVPVGSVDMEFGDRVPPGRAERTATQQPAYRQPRTAAGAVDLERVERRTSEHDGVNRHGDGRPSNARW